MASPAVSTPADPVPADLTSADPAPADPAPADHAPADSAPAEPAPAGPAPADHALADPAPADPAPAGPASADPASADMIQDDVPHLYVISDSQGFVGSFYSLEAADAAVMQRFPMVPFLVESFDVAPGPRDTVWVVLYKAQDAVAFASNSRAAAARVHAARAKVGQVHEDALEYWAQPANSVQVFALCRLNRAARANRVFAGEIDGELSLREQASLAAMRSMFGEEEPQGPPADTQRVSFLDHIVCLPRAETPPTPPPGVEDAERKNAVELHAKGSEFAAASEARERAEALAGFVPGADFTPGTDFVPGAGAGAGTSG